MPSDKRTKAETNSTATGAEWMGKAGDGGRSAAGASIAEKLKMSDKSKTISSIAGKLSAPKLAKLTPEDARKQKVGSFSAGLSKDKILESQARYVAS